MTVKVCVGSACHVKGAYEVIKEIENFIKKENLEKTIELKASFCLGMCTNEVSCEIDNELVSVNKDNIISKLKERLDI